MGGHPGISCAQWQCSLCPACACEQTPIKKQRCRVRMGGGAAHARSVVAEVYASTSDGADDVSTALPRYNVPAILKSRLRKVHSDSLQSSGPNGLVPDFDGAFGPGPVVFWTFCSRPSVYTFQGGDVHKGRASLGKGWAFRFSLMLNHAAASCGD